MRHQLYFPFITLGGSLSGRPGKETPSEKKGGSALKKKEEKKTAIKSLFTIVI